MMGEKQESIEFDTSVEKDGHLQLPDDVRARMALVPGTKLHVRLTTRALAERLRKSGVTDDEVDRIAAVQLTSREEVIRFLLCEGVLQTQKRGRSSRRSKRAS
jgi:hypothetical protein